jgi:AraC family transcriptional regulator
MRADGNGGAVYLHESVPEGLLLDKELKVVGGVAEVARLSFRADFHLESPPLAGHMVDLHLSGPLRTAQRLDGGPKQEGVELSGHFGAVYPAGVPFELWDKERSEDLGVMLDAGFVRRVAEEAGVDPDGFEVLHRFCFRDEPMGRLMLSFLPELRGGGLGGELYAESLANALAVHLLREHSSLGERARRRVAREPSGGLPKRALRRATDYIGDNLASGELSLEKIAAEAGYSPRHFSRAFRESTGLSPHQYVIRQRVEKAKGLLVGTDLPVGEVARACGFAHQSHLAHHTRRLLGLSPTDLRRR